MQIENLSWSSYPKSYSLGHKMISELFSDEVVVEEKIDGSQFSFGVFGSDIRVRSKGVEIDINNCEGMFALAVETVKELAPKLTNGFTYRAEYLRTPKHNTLAYERVPKKHLIIFDILSGPECYLTYEQKVNEATRLGLETVPLIFSGRINSSDQVLDYMEKVSVLGNAKIEGMVFKNYNKFGPDKKILIGKYVSETFKEVHKVNWKKENPKQNDIIILLGEAYKTEARWAKAKQRLSEISKEEISLRDIPRLLKEVQQDVCLECESEIKDKLFAWAWPQISRQIIKGLPEWFKKQLMNEQFKDG